jgi:hypothetical protein
LRYAQTLIGNAAIVWREGKYVFAGYELTRKRSGRHHRHAVIGGLSEEALLDNIKSALARHGTKVTSSATRTRVIL